MKDSNEFKKLVFEKRNQLENERKIKRKKFLSATASILLLVIVCTISLNSNIFNNFFFDNSKQTYTYSDCSGMKDSGYQADFSSEPDDSAYEDKETSKKPFPNTDENITNGECEESNNNEESTMLPNENSQPSVDENVECSEEVEYENSEPTTEVPEYIIDFIPDDFSIFTGTVDLMANFKPNDSNVEEDSPNDEFDAPEDSYSALDDLETNYGIINFAFNLFKAAYINENNNIISPASALYAISMTANGAQGNTKKEMISVLCGTDLIRLNEFLSEYRLSIYKVGKNVNTSISSAIWYDDSVTINKNFLQTNYDYYNADAYKTHFESNEALESINGWIEGHTNGLIKKMFESIEPNTSIILGNTIYFEVSWKEKLTLLNTKEIFTTEKGAVKKVDMMLGSTDYYIENEYCTGFINKYCGNYSFAALLPKEGASNSDIISSLNSKEYYSNIIKANKTDVKFLLPKFECTLDSDLIKPLNALGINDAFNSNANFSKMAMGNGIHIGNVKQNVTISVNENGTLAAASTLIENEESGEPDDGANESSSKLVSLNRPFVYIIYDDITKIPIFIGTVEDI